MKMKKWLFSLICVISGILIHEGFFILSRLQLSQFTAILIGFVFKVVLPTLLPMIVYRENSIKAYYHLGRMTSIFIAISIVLTQLIISKDEISSFSIGMKVGSGFFSFGFGLLISIILAYFVFKIKREPMPINDDTLDV